MHLLFRQMDVAFIMPLVRKLFVSDSPEDLTPHSNAA